MVVSLGGISNEGHKGQKSEERAWKNLREHLTRGEGSFTFEYSATFGQIITKQTKDLLQEYGKSIIFDYSYRHFYTDGYGKDFRVFNLDATNEYSEDQNRLLLTASLLGYYEQLELFEKHDKDLRKYNIEKPLWVFVGSRVISSSSSSLTQGDKESISDVSRIVKFFQYALSSPASLQVDILKILNDETGLRDADGDDIFKGHFKYLKNDKPVAETVLSKVFNGIGNIEAFEIKQADGEIALKTKTSDQYFAVINIGDVPKYAKTLEADTDGDLSIQNDSYTKSLFQSISKTDSTINILIGSKKFIEGWNSWRVSSMGLMNMGKSEGAQIIQLFGRGVRLKGKDLSLKREGSTAPYHVRALQTISIMGLNAPYMNRFLTEIEKEVPEHTDYQIEIKLNNVNAWANKLLTFKSGVGTAHVDEIIELVYSADVAKKVTVDLRHKISTVASGFEGHLAEEIQEYNLNFLKLYADFVDYSSLTLEANRYKLLKGYNKLIIKTETLKRLIREGSYNLYSHPQQFDISDAIGGRIQDIASRVVRDYVNKYYAEKHKESIAKTYNYSWLSDKTHEELFPPLQTIVVRVPIEYQSVVKELEEKICDLYIRDDKTLPTIHFDNHLYSPIASIASGEKFKKIKTIPVRLNEGERDFIVHLRTYVNESPRFEGKKLFVLRNLSKIGVGFFMESSSFYPDFIVWVLDGKKQHLYFLDPKGIMLGETHFNNPKVLWCRETVETIEATIRDDLKKDQQEVEITISAYILSVSTFEQVRKVWSDGNASREIFAMNKILFMDDSMQYLDEVFSNISL